MSEQQQTHTDKKPLADILKDAWGQALLAVDAAEEEAQKLLHRLGDLVDVKPDDARKVAGEFAERLNKQRAALEKSLEDGMKRALARVRIPSREDLQDLQDRVEKLDARLKEILEKRQ